MKSKMMDVSIALFLLVLINILVALGRQQQKKWLKIILVGTGYVLILPAFLFVLRGIS
ncbi:hypothetical protein [Risungbinella massiliensis]|uniref:hypothetical protein n=1 Tax=Risungbinella massiliensis TaxID=1329796 RepID=UPI0012B6031E|nr:hypothetical protein [Risungbinella massiliensis]